MPEPARFTRRPTRRAARRIFARFAGPTPVLLGFAPPLLMRGAVRHAQRPYALAQSSSDPPTLAVVDLGSNSFRLEIGRVEGDQIFRLDTWRETIRFGAGIDEKGRLTLRRAARGARVPRALSRAAVGPASVRRARGGDQHVSRREERRRLPAAGGSRARLSDRHHRRPRGGAPHLSRRRARAAAVAGAATGHRHRRRLDRVHHRPRHDAGASRIAEARVRQHVATVLPDRRAARRRVRRRGNARARGNRGASRASSAANTGAKRMRRRARRSRWPRSSRKTGCPTGGITPDGLARLRKRMVGAGSMSRLQLEGVKPERAPVLAGGFAIMAAARRGARRAAHQSRRRRAAPRRPVRPSRAGPSSATAARSTVESFSERYHIDRAHAPRVAAMAKALYLKSAPRRRTPIAAQRVEWAALLHEIGYSVSHIGFHKHGAYILENADMPGFSAQEQRHLALLVLGCRGGLSKMAAVAGGHATSPRRSWRCGWPCCSITRAARSTRRASRSRSAARSGSAIAKRWLKAHPLTAHLLEVEREEWAALGHRGSGGADADEGRQR